MAVAHPYNAQRVVDINGRLTTVYKRPDKSSAAQRVSFVTPQKAIGEDDFDLNAYSDGRYVSIRPASNERAINKVSADTPTDESSLFMITDYSLNDDGSLDLDCGDSPVLIHLDTMKKARINVSAGNAVIKTYGERHTPEITASGSSHVTVILSAGVGADMVSKDDASVVVVPEDNAFGTVYVQGSNPVEIEETKAKHQVIVLS